MPPKVVVYWRTLVELTRQSHESPEAYERWKAYEQLALEADEMVLDGTDPDWRY